ncbi:MAG TPA: DUF72 domain-containing protein [Stellaceae bacterium]|nr:DUF72 domain-containing protein [Stellaceae bacterium]
MNAGAAVRVGIGGWVFPPWRGVLYPPGLPQARELAYASRQVTAIEINGTFYGSQKPESFRRWHDETPEDFVFSLKGPRFATHRRDLATAGPSIDRFLASGVLELRDKLGPIIWQFAPFLRFDESAFGDFLALLPSEINGRALRHVVEVRHPSFAAPAFTALLQHRKIAVALVDDEKYPAIDTVTTDFVYARLRRSSLEEPLGYAPERLDAWAGRAQDWTKSGLDAFIYFINGAKVRAPAAAAALLQRLAPGITGIVPAASAEA